MCKHWSMRVYVVCWKQWNQRGNKKVEGEEDEEEDVDDDEDEDKASQLAS